MNAEEVEDLMNKLVKKIQEFQDEPNYECAMWLDCSLSILRCMLGEDAFLSMHYFKMAHNDVIQFIEKTRKANEKKDKEN